MILTHSELLKTSSYLYHFLVSQGRLKFMSVSETTSVEALKAKSDGSAAWSTGDYDGAITHFTTAIDLGGDKEFMQVLYSNRSAAYLKLSKTKEALKDAEDCVKVNSQWGKGYLRKGDVLYAQKKYTEAYNAYNSGARVSPGDKPLKDRLDLAMRAIGNEADRNRSRNNGAGGGASGQRAYDGNAVQPLHVQYVHCITLICLMLYLIPFFSYRYRNMAHKCATACYMGLAVYDLYATHGMIQFNNDYGSKVMTDPLIMELILGAALLFSKPYLFATAPVAIKSMLTFTNRIFRNLALQLPAVQSQIEGMVARYMPSMSGVNLVQLVSPAAAKQFNDVLVRLSPVMEVYQGVYLIMELLLPSRNVLQIYIWWQYLRLRYMADAAMAANSSSASASAGHVKAAFKNLDTRLQSLLTHRMCPEVVRRGYAMLKTFLAKQVELPTAGEAGSGSSSGAGAAGGGIGSMLSKCTIM